MHVSVALEVSATETKKIVRMNMARNMNVSQVGNILYLGTIVARGGYYVETHPSQI